jgi:hypothetical protein
MTGKARHVTLTRPATVTIHNDGNMAWYFCYWGSGVLSFGHAHRYPPWLFLKDTGRKGPVVTA